MTSQEIITNFELQVSDMTELSSAEELYILNRVYNKVMTARPWEISKTSSSGTISGSGVDSMYITLPSDFAYFSPNANYTDNTYEYQGNNAPIVIFIGSNRTQYKVVNYSDRVQYLGKTGYAYLDLANSKIMFTGTPVSDTYLFDYIKYPTALTLGTSPVIPSIYHDIFVYGMAIEDSILQLSPKATSYAPENQAKYDSMMADLAFWNSQFLMN